MFASPAPQAYQSIVIVGGGCYGAYYVRQLLRARDAKRISFDRLVVVDRNANCQVASGWPDERAVVIANSEWAPFFDMYLQTARTTEIPSRDAIVPSPLMPHLMYEWLLRPARARWPRRTVESRPVTVPAGTPYDTLAPDGTRYVSFADWLCPVHCIEPSTCPVIREPRTWEMTEAMHALAAATPAAGPVLFTCRHRVYGVGMFDVSTVLAGDETVAAAGASPAAADVLVATVSACHGAASLLHLGPAR